MSLRGPFYLAPTYTPLLYSGKTLRIKAPSNLSRTRLSGILKWQQKCDLESKKYGNIVK